MAYYLRKYLLTLCLGDCMTNFVAWQLCAIQTLACIDSLCAWGSQYLCKIFNEGVKSQVSGNILICTVQEWHVV